MDLGTHARLKERHAFRYNQPDLSEAVGSVCEFREEDGQELVNVLFHEHDMLTPDVPVEFFEVAPLH